MDVLLHDPRSRPRAFIEEAEMRTCLGFVCGLVVGIMVQSALGAGVPDVVSLNHVALSVEHFDEAAKFYTNVMAFPQAFRWQQPDGQPFGAYYQVSRNTFIELQPVSPNRPAGVSHIGIEASNLDALVRRLRASGVDVSDPTVSPRSKSRIAQMTTPQGVRFELLEFGPDSLHRKVINNWKER